MTNTYNPSIIGVNNVANVTAYPARYISLGEVVFVQGKFDVTTTSVAPFKVSISLPTPLNSNGQDVDTSGTGSTSVAGIAQSRTGFASANNTTAVYYSHASTSPSSLNTIHYMFTYKSA